MIIILGSFPFFHCAGDNALVLAGDIACHTQPHACWQVVHKIGNELVVAVWCLNEDLSLALSFDATHHFPKTCLTGLTINRQISLEGKSLTIEARGHQTQQDT